MAHYEGINVANLISAIQNCKSKVNTNASKDLLADGKSLVWEGTDAKENLVDALKEINNSTKELENELENCLKIAKNMKNYKDTKKELDNLKSQKQALQLTKSRTTSTTPAATIAYLNSEIANKTRLINAKQEQLNSLAKTLTNAGYPPV